MVRFVLKTLCIGLAALALASLPARAQQGPYQNWSAFTSATPNTPTQLIMAAGTNGKRKMVIRVEGSAIVCFSQFHTTDLVSTGQTGTWCLKGGTAANDGTAGSYSTPTDMSDWREVWMVSATASVLVTAWTE